MSNSSVLHTIPQPPISPLTLITLSATTLTLFTRSSSLRSSNLTSACAHDGTALDCGLPAHLPPLLFPATGLVLLDIGALFLLWCLWGDLASRRDCLEGLWSGKALGLVPWRGVVERERFGDKGWVSGLAWDGDSGVSVCVEGGVD